MHLRIPRSALAAVAIASLFVCISAVVLNSSCATTKGSAGAIGTSCADQVTPQVVKVVRDISLSTAESDLEGLLKGFSICVGRGAAQKALDELAALDTSQHSNAPASMTPAVSLAVGKDRLARWLAGHPEHAMIIPYRLWRDLMGKPPARRRANC